MKKFILAILSVMIFSTISLAANEQYFGYNMSVETYDYNGRILESHIETIDGDEIWFMYEDDNPDGKEFYYLKVNQDGNTEKFMTEYQLHGQNSQGLYIITEDQLVKTSEFDAHAGEPQLFWKYGLMDEQFNVIFEPIWDKNDVNWEPYRFDFTDGFTERVYDAEYYYYANQEFQWQPFNSKKMLINSNYDTYKDYDTFYNTFITENRYIVKDNVLSIMIDFDMDVISDEYTHIIELDDGKFYASKDPLQENPLYSYVIDENGVEIDDFNPKIADEISPWAESYVKKARELGITEESIHVAFRTSFFKEEITRIEFCRLLVNTLGSIGYELPEIEVFDVFSDTEDLDVLIANKLAIIDGIGDGKFDPYSNLTREQAAKMLVNVAEILEIDTSMMTDESEFSDLATASSWAIEPILKISSLKTNALESVMGGTSEDEFSPKDVYTVEQALTTLVRLSDIKNEQ